MFSRFIGRNITRKYSSRAFIMQTGGEVINIAKKLGGKKITSSETAPCTIATIYDIKGTKLEIHTHGLWETIITSDNPALVDEIARLMGEELNNASEILT